MRKTSRRTRPPGPPSSPRRCRPSSPSPASRYHSAALESKGSTAALLLNWLGMAYPHASRECRGGSRVGDSRSEVVVSSGGLLGVEVGWRDEPGDAVAGLDGPLFFVDQVVMVGTKECSVVCAGGAAVGPVGDVVGFAPGGGDGAAGEGAALVAGGDGFADVGREDAAGAADVEDSAGGAEEDGDEVCVAGDFAAGGGGDGSGEHHRPRAHARARPARAARGCGGAFGEVVVEVLVVDGDHDLGAVAAGGGQPAVGEGEFAAADEAVEEFLRAGAPVQPRTHSTVRAVHVVRLDSVGSR